MSASAVLPDPRADDADQPTFSGVVAVVSHGAFVTDTEVMTGEGQSSTWRCRADEDPSLGFETGRMGCTLKEAEIHCRLQIPKVPGSAFTPMRAVPIRPPWCRTGRAHSQRRRATSRATVRLAYRRTHARSTFAPPPNVFERAGNVRRRPWSGTKSYCAGRKDPPQSRSGRRVRGAVYSGPASYDRRPARR